MHSGILEKALVTLHHHHEGPLLRNLFTYIGGCVADGHRIPLENLTQIMWSQRTDLGVRKSEFSFNSSIFFFFFCQIA